MNRILHHAFRRAGAILFCGMVSALCGEQLNINQFRGLDRDNDPLFVTNGMSPDSENIVTDNMEGLGPRPGFVLFSTETLTDGPWVFPVSNGNKYLIVQDSNTLKAALNSTNFTVIIATVNTQVRTAATSLADKFYWSSADGLKHWDTVSVTVDSPALNFDSLVTHKGRLCGSGVAGDKRTIYISKYLNGSDWQLRTDPTEEDPARIQVQGSLDENLTGLFASYKDILMWFKANSFGGVYGSRRSSFLSVAFSQNVGSAYPETVRDCDGELRFLGSQRAVWGYQGANLYKLTKGQNGSGIDSLMNTLIQGDATSRSWTQTTQNDWELGTTTGALDSSVSPGDLVFTAQQFIQAPDDDFEDGDYTTGQGWTVTSGSFAVITGSLDARVGIPPTGVQNTIYVPSQFSTGTWTITGDLRCPERSCYIIFMSSNNGYAGNSNEQYFLRITDTVLDLAYQATGSGETILVSSSVVSPTKISVTLAADGVFITSFTDSIVTDAPMARITNTSMKNSNFFVVRDDDGGKNFFTINAVETSTPNYVLSSTFTSQTFAIGATANSWGVFAANSNPNGAQVTYGIYSDTNSSLNIRNPTTFIASQTILPGAIPTIRISSFVTVSVLFTRPTSSSTIRLNDFSISWIDGNPLRAASLWTNQRYWIGVAIGSATANNTVLVFDRNRQWQYWTGINMTGAVIFNGSSYLGNPAGVFQAETGYSDNGAAISSRFNTQAYYPSKPNYASFFRQIYLTTMNSAETLKTKYFVNGLAAGYDLPDVVMNSNLGYQDVKLPFAMTSLQQGNFISFQFSVSGKTNWRLLNASLYFDPDKTLHD